MKKKSWEDQMREKHGITAPKFTLYLTPGLQTLIDEAISKGDKSYKATKEWRDNASETSAYKYGQLFDAHDKARNEYEKSLMALGDYVKKTYMSLSPRQQDIED